MEQNKYYNLYYENSTIQENLKNHWWTDEHVSVFSNSILHLSRIFHQLNQNSSLYSQIQTPHFLRSQKTLENQCQNPTEQKLSTRHYHPYQSLNTPNSQALRVTHFSRVSFSRRSPSIFFTKKLPLNAVLGARICQIGLFIRSLKQ